MADIIGFENYKPHLSGDAVCIDCKHGWTAVAPVGVTELQCPRCKTNRGSWVYTAQPDQMWACSCGNCLFYISPTHALCAKCGSTQEFN